MTTEKQTPKTLQEIWEENSKIIVPTETYGLEKDVKKYADVPVMMEADFLALAELYASERERAAWDRACKYLLTDIAKTIRQGNKETWGYEKAKRVLEIMAGMIEIYPFEEFKPE